MFFCAKEYSFKFQILITFSEPEFPYLEALAPYQPLAMKVTILFCTSFWRVDEVTVEARVPIF